MDLVYLHGTLAIPFLFAILIPLCRNVLRGLHSGWLVLPVPLLLFGYFVTQLGTIRSGPVTETVPWMPSLGVSITLYLDGLSLLFSLLISGIGALVVLYSIYYMDKNKEAVHRFYAYLLLFMGAMLGVVLSDNLMVLYGFWELTSISSFLLIAFWHHRERSQYGALKSMLITVFGGLAMFAGFLLLYTMTGTLSVREIVGQAGEIVDHSLFLPSMLLILLGAFTKSAQFPFHIWLPDAMEAPTPVSAYLHSATMVKAGLYLVARMSPVFAVQPQWFWLVTSVGLATLLYGSWQAVKQKDLKAMLAYSTISQLGLIMSLLGMGAAAAFFTDVDESVFYTKAAAAAIFHLLNHAMFKGALFMVVGIVDHETGTRDLRKLGGLMSLMPVTFSVAAIGVFSMAGLPPFNGFLSKEMFFTAALNIQRLELWSFDTWAVLVPVIAWTGSVLTFVYSMVLLWQTFGGKLSGEIAEAKPHEAPVGMLIPPVILASLAVITGLFPNVLAHALIEPALESVYPGLLAQGDSFDVHIRMWHGWTAEIAMTIGLVIAGAALVLFYRKRNMQHYVWPSGLSLNRLYDGGLRNLERVSRVLTDTYMTGSVRQYLIYIFLFFVVSLGTTYGLSQGIRFDWSGYAPITVYETAVVAAMVIAAAAVPFARSRISAILYAGAVGYMVSLLFVLYRAPDLALTQMIVETVSVGLFLLCFYHLPKLKKEIATIRFKLVNLLISISVGVVVTLIALAASGNRMFESISDYYIRESYRLAGGKNIVNVILVDFRGFDTMLEIVVLGIASLGVYAMVKLRLQEGRTMNAAGKRQASAGHLPGAAIFSGASNDVILKTVSKVAIVVILLFSLHLFLAGHNSPGGGFIGALMTSAALVLAAIAFGLDAVGKRLPVDFRKLTAVGLLVAISTGLGSFLFGVPFLSHAFGYFNLPLLGKTELATAVLFDLGVYLSVVGVTMTLVLSVGRDK